MIWRISITLDNTTATYSYVGTEKGCKELARELMHSLGGTDYSYSLA